MLSACVIRIYVLVQVLKNRVREIRTPDLNVPKPYNIYVFSEGGNKYVATKIAYYDFKI